MTDIPASMTPWSGGDRAPDDWDGGEVLLSTGYVVPLKRGLNDFWTAHTGEDHDILARVLAYTPTAPVIAPDEGGVRQALTDEGMRLGVMAFQMDAASIERDTRFSDLTSGEIESLVHAVLSSQLLLSAAPSAPISERERGLVEALREIAATDDHMGVAIGAPAQCAGIARDALASFDQGRG